LYLDALKEVGVDISRQEWMRADALTMTYTFYIRDGSAKTFLLQEGRVGIDLQYDPNDVMYLVVTIGRTEKFPDDLESLDSMTLMQLRAVEQSNADEQARQTIQLKGDTLSLVLEENPTTGDRWSYTIEPEGALVCIGDEYRLGRNSLEADGGGGQRAFTFQTTGMGDVLLRLVRMQPDGSPGHRTAFQVYVKETVITAVERVNQLLY